MEGDYFKGQDEALSRAHVFEWHKGFSEEGDSVEDDKPVGLQDPRLQTKTCQNSRHGRIPPHISDQTVNQHFYTEVLKSLKN
ncbi:hypothetical protein TNCV_4637181 [Trichonephila clavipes]|nr:hypothetical protein TNCV_4637181 [Trichonephila clavipes]